MSKVGWSRFRIEHFDCQCFSYDHSFRICFDPEEDDLRFAEMWIEACFPPRSGWWQRLKVAAKYVWNGDRDWTFGSTVIRDEDVSRLRAFFRDYEAYLWGLKEKQKVRGNEPDKKDSV